MAFQLISPYWRHEAHDHVTVIHFTGVQVSLDEETVITIRRQLYAFADKMDQSRLVLDFGNVEYVSGVALGVLVTLHKKLVARGRFLTLRNLTPQVHEVFKITRLDQFLHLPPEESRSQLSPPGRNGESPIGVLVVDDDPAVRSVLGSWLGRKGFEVWTAAHGQQAIELYRRHQHAIAVVLLDLVMPGMDGPHTLTALKKVSPTVQVCFMTGNPFPHSERELLSLGAVRVFRKPFAFADVVDTLKQLAGLPRRARQERWIEIPLERSVTDVGPEPQAG